jgi:hypothetical protein
MGGGNKVFYMNSKNAVSPAIRLLHLVLLGLLALKLGSQPVQAAAATNETVIRLTVELQDGSRVVGQSLDKTLRFQSILLGDLDLAVKDIRSIDCDQTNSAKLTTAGGDKLTVRFAPSELRLKTGFGKVELPVASIRRVLVSVTGPSKIPRDGLVALWSAEGNADDSVGGRHGQLENQAGYAPGVIGQAFAFHSIGDGVTAPATDLPIGTSDRTIDCWVYIESFIPGADPCGVGYGNFGKEGECYAFGPQKNDHRLIFSQWGDAIVGPILEAGRWYNIAVTSVGTSSIKLYVDGVNVASGALNFNTPAGSQIHIGQIQAPYCLRQLIGRIDEVAVYDRALSADEIKAIYAEGEPSASAPTR